MGREVKTPVSQPAPGPFAERPAESTHLLRISKSQEGCQEAVHQPLYLLRIHRAAERETISHYSGVGDRRTAKKSFLPVSRADFTLAANAQIARGQCSPWSHAPSAFTVGLLSLTRKMVVPQLGDSLSFLTRHSREGGNPFRRPEHRSGTGAKRPLLLASSPPSRG